MSSFTDALTVTQLDMNWKLWRVERDFIYEVGEKGSGRTITVPAGFITDGASVPMLLWNILPAWGSYSRAALVHDYLCHNVHKGTPHPEAPTRKAADKIFWEAMKVCGTGVIVRTIMYIGVRIGDYSNKLPWASKNIVSKVNQ